MAGENMSARAFLPGILIACCSFAADGPHRIVSLSTNMTEMLYGVGAFDQIGRAHV